MNKTLLMSGLILFALSGCSSDESVCGNGLAQEKASLPEVYFTVSDTTRTVGSESKAMEIANRFLTTSEKGTRTSEDGVVSTIYQEDGSPAMYVVNYGENGGFVIVSATKDTEPILAYSVTGSFSLDNIEESPSGMWLNDTKYYIEHASELPDSVKLGASHQWEQLTSTKVPASRLETRGWRDHDEVVAVYNALEFYRNQGYEIYENPQTNGNSYTFFLGQALESLSDMPDSDGFSQREKSFLLIKYTNNTIEERGPLITTKWDQGSPYNLKLINKYPKARSLGCATIALGQLMKYYKKPNGSFKYDKMPDELIETSGEQFEVLSDFLMLLGEELGIDYASGESGALTSSVVNVLNEYGFKNARIVDYDYNTVKSNLKSGPIYLRGERITSYGRSGHGWVCDGYQFIAPDTEYILITYNGQYMDAIPTACFDVVYTEREYHSGTDFFHMNWGWGGYGNGFFSPGSWKVMMSSGEIWNYEFNQKAIIGFN